LEAEKAANLPAKKSKLLSKFERRMGISGPNKQEMTPGALTPEECLSAEKSKEEDNVKEDTKDLFAILTQHIK
jgi:hypothetical protein